MTSSNFSVVEASPSDYDPEAFKGNNALRVVATLLLGGVIAGFVIVPRWWVTGWVWIAAAPGTALQGLEYLSGYSLLARSIGAFAFVFAVGAIVAIWRDSFLSAAGLIAAMPVLCVAAAWALAGTNPLSAGFYSESFSVIGFPLFALIVWSLAGALAVSHVRQKQVLGGLSPAAARAVWVAEARSDTPQLVGVPDGGGLGVVPAACNPVAVHGDVPTLAQIPIVDPTQLRADGGGFNAGWKSPIDSDRVSLQVAVPGAATPLVGTLPRDTEYATFWTRLGARFIDFFFVLFVFVPILAGTTAGIAAATGADPLIAALIAVWLDIGLWEFAYYLVGASHGQTIGKRVLGIKVCREDNGQRIGFWKSLSRMFASVLSSLVLYIGWLAPLWTPKHQTWHDSMTHTVVIRDRQARLATPAVVWGLVWTLISGAAFGGLAAWGINAVEDAGYDLNTISDSTYDYDYGSNDEVSDYDGGYSNEEDAYEEEYGYGEQEQNEYNYGDGGSSDGSIGSVDLDSIAGECETGYMSSCDELFENTASGSTLEAFAMTCGDRRPLPSSHTSCVGWETSRSGSSFDDDEYSGSSSASSALSSERLESIAAGMQSEARALSGSWVVQLSSSTTRSNNQAGITPMTESEILDRLHQAESRYSGSSLTPLLLWTGEYNFKYSDMWVVVLDRPYSSYEDVLGFCASEGYDRDHCLAKYLDRSSNWDHTSKLMPE